MLTMAKDYGTEDDDSIGLDSSENKLNSIFECPMIQKHLRDGIKYWSCKWCNNKWKDWNATRALHHVLKISREIKGCIAKIDLIYKSKYQALRERQLKNKIIKLHSKM